MEQEQEFDLLYEVLHFLLFLLKYTLNAVCGTITALIPAGVLPRKSIKNKVCLITGSASGIGRLLAIKFGELGAIILLWDVNEKGNKETLKILKQKGITAHAYTVNLADKQSIYSTAVKVKQQVGDVYMVINNAGIVSGQDLVELSDESMELTIDVNVKSLFYVTKAFLSEMLDADEGHIVTMASIAGHAGMIGLTDYCASKHAAVGFMSSLYRELAFRKSNVKTTTVSPYYINTGMFEGVTESRLRYVCPILEPDYVADRIVDAVLTDTVDLILPRFLYFIKFAGTFMPQSCVDAIYDYTGTDSTMLGFKGRN
ncbi:unnamed protein product [Bursaphelenchus okinawaensis]|uniref:Short-chain dehydrogenase/reductase 3 n=1 Tax=Bursaphelenchus okinawaensis TaxID=465554 RepID=A0A811JQB1_9BILA|nr:unnamed protein product [Bursaphelenchus okinawaensis]CAG9077259.1 unnamed protein product [Bursaphelenchus okinawaensis]